MKKSILLLAVSILLFTSCSKDEESNVTTYQIVNEMSYTESTSEYLNGSLWEVVIYQYIGDDIAKQNNIKSVKYGGGKSDKIKVEDNVDKINMSFRLLPEEDPHYDKSFNNRLYVKAFTFVKENTNNIITVDDETRITTIPKSPSLKSAFNTDFKTTTLGVLMNKLIQDN